MPSNYLVPPKRCQVCIKIIVRHVFIMVLLSCNIMNSLSMSNLCTNFCKTLMPQKVMQMMNDLKKSKNCTTDNWSYHLILFYFILVPSYHIIFKIFFENLVSMQGFQKIYTFKFFTYTLNMYNLSDEKHFFFFLFLRTLLCHVIILQCEFFLRPIF